MQYPWQSVCVILVIAAITAFTRFAPFIIFGRKEHVPSIVLYLGAVMPAAIIIMLIVYCLRNTVVMTFPFAIAEIVAIIATIALHWRFRNALMSIAGGTILYMMLIQTVFI